jgi:hypothetical protein
MEIWSERDFVVGRGGKSGEERRRWEWVDMAGGDGTEAKRWRMGLVEGSNGDAGNVTSDMQLQVGV